MKLGKNIIRLEAILHSHFQSLIDVSMATVQAYEGPVTLVSQVAYEVLSEVLGWKRFQRKLQSFVLAFLFR
jgi:hypothetical protein